MKKSLATFGLAAMLATTAANAGTPALDLNSPVTQFWIRQADICMHTPASQMTLSQIQICKELDQLAWPSNNGGVSVLRGGQ
jgi:hypothetical protein